MSIFARIFKRGSYDPANVGAATMSEVPPAYNPKYPENNVLAATASGHIIELDDTPGAERIHIYHRSGSHIEMQPNGTVKYKTVSRRQDVTIGPHEMIIQGDWNVTTDGVIKLYARGGNVSIQSDGDIEFRAKKNIKFRAEEGEIIQESPKKIALRSTKIELGGGVQGSPTSKPVMTIPSDVQTVFGVPIVVAGGLVTSSLMAKSLTKLATMLLPLAGPAVMATEMIRLVKKVQSGVGAVSDLQKDTNGEPQVPEIEQPEEIPLSSPRLYRDTSRAAIQLRDRQLDTPEDVEDTETYSNHLKVCGEIGDYAALPTAKNLPGQVYGTDETDPVDEPLPYRSFALSSGTVSCELGNTVVLGTDTTFTEELSVGQSLVIGETVVKIGGIQNNTSLILSAPWPSTTTANVTPLVPKFRPFQEFFQTYRWRGDTPLGNSGLMLQDMLRNFVAPVIEKSTTSTFGGDVGPEDGDGSPGPGPNGSNGGGSHSSPTPDGGRTPPAV